jgi:hypothetical protein
MHARLGRFTGSTFAGLLGRSPYGPPSEYCRRQMGMAVSEASLEMELGTIYESAIRKAAQYKLTLGMAHHQLDKDRYRRFVKPSSTFHAVHGDWLVVHPDGLFLDARQLIQVKRHDPRIARQYKEPGSLGESDNDGVPLHELIQCQIEIECVASTRPKNERAEWRVIWLAVEFGDATGPRLYRIVKDRELTASLLMVGQRFWRFHMQPGNPVRPSDDDWNIWRERGQLPEPPSRRITVQLTREDLNATPVTRW